MSAIQGMNGRNSDAPQGPLMTPKQTLGLIGPCVRQRCRMFVIWA